MPTAPPYRFSSSLRMSRALLACAAALLIAAAAAHGGHDHSHGEESHSASLVVLTDESFDKEVGAGGTWLVKFYGERVLPGARPRVAIERGALRKAGATARACTAAAHARRARPHAGAPLLQLSTLALRATVRASPAHLLLRHPPPPPPLPQRRGAATASASRPRGTSSPRRWRTTSRRTSARLTAPCTRPSARRWRCAATRRCSASRTAPSRRPTRSPTPAAATSVRTASARTRTRGATSCFARSKHLERRSMRAAAEHSARRPWRVQPLTASVRFPTRYPRARSHSLQARSSRGSPRTRRRPLRTCTRAQENKSLRSTLQRR